MLYTSLSMQSPVYLYTTPQGRRCTLTMNDDGVRDRGDGVDGVGPVGEGAAGSGLEEEDERCPAEGERSGHLERCGSSGIGERSESVWTHELE